MAIMVLVQNKGTGSMAYFWVYFVMALFNLAVALGLWIFAPLVTRYTTANMADALIKEGEPIQLIANAIIMAAGFLILTQAFTDYTRLIMEAIDLHFNFGVFIRATIITTLSLFLILKPQKIFCCTRKCKKGA